MLTSQSILISFQCATDDEIDEEIDEFEEEDIKSSTSQKKKDKKKKRKSKPAFSFDFDDGQVCYSFHFLSILPHPFFDYLVWSSTISQLQRISDVESGEDEESDEESGEDSSSEDETAKGTHSDNVRIMVRELLAFRYSLCCYWPTAKINLLSCHLISILFPAACWRKNRSCCVQERPEETAGKLQDSTGTRSSRRRFRKRRRRRRIFWNNRGGCPHRQRRDHRRLSDSVLAIVAEPAAAEGRGAHGLCERDAYSGPDHSLRAGGEGHLRFGRDRQWQDGRWGHTKNYRVALFLLFFIIALFCSFLLLYNVA